MAPPPVSRGLARQMLAGKSGSIRAGGIQVLKNGSIIAATLITVILALVLVGSSYTGNALAQAVTPTAVPSGTPTLTVTPTATPVAGGTPTPVPSPTQVPSPTVVSTPTPTPGPRQIFSQSSASWAGDHVTINVINNGGPISVVAWINNITNSATVSVGAGESLAVSTPSITTNNGQIVSFGFDAYDNGTLIDSYNQSIAAISSEIPTGLPPESVTISSIVTDASNGTPIQGATVTLRSLSYGKTYPSVTTGSDGTFTSPEMYPDVYTITVTATGYQPTTLTTNGKITGDSTVSAISLTKLSGNPTATPVPTPSPSPSIVDSWTSLISSPQVCIGTLSALVAVIAGSLGIYEWFARQRSARLKKEKEEGSKSGESKDEPDVKKL